MLPFHLILVNNLIQNVTNFTVWFALVFWAFLETRSVFVTGMIGGIYLVFTAGLAIWFGSLVDHHTKKRVMLGSSAASFVLYAASLIALLRVPDAALQRQSAPELWLFVLVVMLAVIAGNVRMIALPTLVTALIEEDNRDKANGLVGMVTGIGFLVTSGISGFLVAWGGMQATLWFALALTALAFVHLLTVRFGEPEPTAAAPGETKRIDLKGTIAVIAAVPGLFALIFFATFNNLLGGVFMALMDAYGLSLMAVQEWGLLWAFASCGFIVSGLIIARTGLGANPLRTMLLVNLVVWSVAAVFTLQSSVILLAVACFVWLFLNPFAEASEQTTLQKVVPYERQWRVFGFAQSVEQAAAPFTAFLVGPLTQFVVIPFMSDGGAGAAAIGAWYGTGPERGMALVFSVAGLLGVAMTAAAFNSRPYRQLSAAYAKPTEEPERQSAQ
jgi:DHA3 family multidrug efflux protein-like MFS transporter